jgi:Tfp pilus assembly protein PilE
VVLSFVIPGLGQLYNGETGKALLIFLTSWLFFPWVIGIFDAYRRAKRIKAENIPVRSRPGCIIALAAAVTFFFFVIIIISLLAAIAIPHMLNARVAANEAAARDSISSIEAACDIYIAKNGANPASENDLLPYLPQGLPKANGYDVSIDFPSGGYIIKAAPQACNVSASKVFILRQGSEISSEDCRVRDER